MNCLLIIDKPINKRENVGIEIFVYSLTIHTDSLISETVIRLLIKRDILQT